MSGRERRGAPSPHFTWWTFAMAGALPGPASDQDATPGCAAQPSRRAASPGPGGGSILEIEETPSTDSGRGSIEQGVVDCPAMTTPSILLNPKRHAPTVTSDRRR